jgi:hypothetical protein
VFDSHRRQIHVAFPEQSESVSPVGSLSCQQLAALPRAEFDPPNVPIKYVQIHQDMRGAARVECGIDVYVTFIRRRPRTSL